MTIYEVNQISYTYPGADKKVLDKASVHLDKGQILCVLGPNGAGKTTLLNAMAGLITPDSGEITLCGKTLSRMKPKEIAGLVGYVPQIHTPAFDYRVMDFVLMGRAPAIGALQRPGRKDREKVMDILEDMHISHLAEKSYIEVSGGERQQILIARALAQEPQVLLFDEPTAHLDYGNQHRVLKLVRKMAQKGLSVMITTHNPDHALLLGDMAAIVHKQGNITEGNSSEIMTEERLSQVYDIDLKLLYIEEIERIACTVPKL